MLMDFDYEKVTIVTGINNKIPCSSNDKVSSQFPSSLAKEIEKYGLTFRNVNGVFANVNVPRGACVKCNVVHNQSFGGIYFLKQGDKWLLRCKHEKGSCVSKMKPFTIDELEMKQPDIDEAEMNCSDIDDVIP